MIAILKIAFWGRILKRLYSLRQLKQGKQTQRKDIDKRNNSLHP